MKTINRLVTSTWHLRFLQADPSVPLPCPTESVRVEVIRELNGTTPCSFFKVFSLFPCSWTRTNTVFRMFSANYLLFFSHVTSPNMERKGRMTDLWCNLWFQESDSQTSSGAQRVNDNEGIAAPGGKRIFMKCPKLSQLHVVNLFVCAIMA